jgi:hypothetical protein
VLEQQEVHQQEEAYPLPPAFLLLTLCEVDVYRDGPQRL